MFYGHNESSGKRQSSTSKPGAARNRDNICLKFTPGNWKTAEFDQARDWLDLLRVLGVQLQGMYVCRKHSRIRASWWGDYFMSAYIKKRSPVGQNWLVHVWHEFDAILHRRLRTISSLAHSIVICPDGPLDRYHSISTNIFS